MHVIGPTPHSTSSHAALPDLQDGCNGGGIHWGLEYAIANGGLTASAAYPYVGASGTCDSNAASWKVVQIDGYKWVTPGSEQALMAAVAKGVSADLQGGIHAQCSSLLPCSKFAMAGHAAITLQV